MSNRVESLNLQSFLHSQIKQFADSLSRKVAHPGHPQRVEANQGAILVEDEQFWLFVDGGTIVPKSGFQKEGRAWERSPLAKWHWKRLKPAERRANLGNNHFN